MRNGRFEGINGKEEANEGSVNGSHAENLARLQKGDAYAGGKNVKGRVATSRTQRIDAQIVRKLCCKTVYRAICTLRDAVPVPDQTTCLLFMLAAGGVET